MTSELECQQQSRTIIDFDHKIIQLQQRLEVRQQQLEECQQEHQQQS